MIHNFLVIVLLAALTQVTPAQAKTYKIATASPDGLSWMKKLRASVKTIDEQTEGRVRFKIYPGGVQGGDLVVLRKMRVGQLHGGAVAAGSLTRFYPDLQIYNLPLQFKNYAEVDYIRAEMDQMIATGLEDAGIVTFAFTETGFAYLLSKTPVSSIDDLAQLKAWIPKGDPIAAELIDSFGISPIPLHLIDVLQGLQTGMINAVVVPPVVALALQWHNHVEYMTDLPIIYIYSMLAMDKKVYDEIAPEDKVIVRAVLDEMFREVEADTRLDNAKAYNALISVGIELVEVTPDQLLRWQAAADRSVSNLVKSGEISSESVQLYLENLQKYRQGAQPAAASE